MSDLHFEPLGYKQPPFNHTGVGYFGPLYVPVRRSTEKRCEFLFTCLTTRAFTCLVPSLDIVLVSWASNVVVHQARSSRITARTLLVRKRNYELEQHGSDHFCTQRKLNPPVAPPHGGSWERLVRIV